MRSKQISNQNTTLLNNDKLSYMFRPTWGHHQSDIQNVLRKYTHHILEDRSHFLQIMLHIQFLYIQFKMKISMGQNM